MPIRKQFAVPAYVKNGTPVGSQSQCAKCEHAHVLRGYRESEELTYCNFAIDLILVPFKVRDCSNYSDKTRPTWDQMQDLAIEIRPVSFAKPAGFRKKSESENAAVKEGAVTP
jgi:hypothetical protein